jgi:predicted metalloprotease with PDZ domain
MSVENLPDEHGAAERIATPLTRETILPNHDRGRIATLVAMCSLAGVAVGFGLSTAAMQAASDASRTVIVTDVRPAAVDPELLPNAGGDLAWLGIHFVTEGHDAGALVNSVVPGSPATVIGLHADDVVVGYDRTPIRTSDDLVHMVRASHVGDRPVLQVRRDGHSVQLRPVLANVPRSQRASISRD